MISTPRTTIAITVRNGARTIGKVLSQLLPQTEAGTHEIVVSVGESTDGTWEVVTSAAAATDRLVAVRAERSGIPAGRNAAIAASRGALILTCDADDEVSEDWVAQMEAALELHDVVAGRVEVVPGGVSHAVEGSPIAGTALRTYPYDYLRFGLTANLAFRRTAYKAIGGFDERMVYGDDVDFCWTAQERGLSIGESSGAVRKYGRPEASQRFRQHYRFGRTDVDLYVKHRSAGMKRQGIRALKAWGWIAVNMRSAVVPNRRSLWSGATGQRVGRLAGSLSRRVVYP